ncbi:hypothetical protein B0H16DRAFT_1714280 [Mycena metata]|uniref:Uncharacterized protein n=1 Tax=Mycena metata TaxID=1033252 RepID=A0AAD7JWQ7_9AGAR|nr:hypothetical protein B0H16DRAFT_1714280 [Mycena metata]
MEFTEEELRQAGLLGDGDLLSKCFKLCATIQRFLASPSSTSPIHMWTYPFTSSSQNPLSSPASPTLCDASTAFSALGIGSDVTRVSAHQPSPWEKSAYYHGVSVEPPELLYRSDYLDTPFPHPQGRIQNLSNKTAHGVFNTPLNAVWHTVAPKIRDMLKALKIRYSVIHLARFTTHGEDGESTLGPVVIWIATHPGSTTTDDAHLASPDIIALLETNGVCGAVVEWIEGVVERL